MIRTALAGFGWWGRHLLPRLQESPSFELVSIVEPDQELHDEIRRHEVDVSGDLDEALADKSLQAVILTTPHMFHEEQVVACAEAGLHVFCEKPLGLTGESARRSLSACRNNGVVLGIGHERRFEPAMQRLKRMIAGGELGVIMHAEAAFSHDKLVGVPSGSWRTSAKQSPGAGMTGMGIHLTDLLIWLFGPVSEVQALTRDRLLGWETGDMVVAQLGFAEGMTASLQAILATPHFIRFHVFGSKMWVEIRNATHPDTPGGVTELTTCETGGEPVTETLGWTDSVVENLESFAAAVRGEAAYPWTDTELVHNIELYEAICASASAGETVRVR